MQTSKLPNLQKKPSKEAYCFNLGSDGRKRTSSTWEMIFIIERNQK